MLVVTECPPLTLAATATVFSLCDHSIVVGVAVGNPEVPLSCEFLFLANRGDIRTALDGIMLLTVSLMAPFRIAMATSVSDVIRNYWIFILL